MCLRRGKIFVIYPSTIAVCCPTCQSGPVRLAGAPVRGSTGLVWGKDLYCTMLEGRNVFWRPQCQT